MVSVVTNLSTGETTTIGPRQTVKVKAPAAKKTS
jgi:hypothetical protein